MRGYELSTLIIAALAFGSIVAVAIICPRTESTHYRVITADSIETLEKEVEEAMEDGWKVSGEFRIEAYPDAHTASGIGVKIFKEMVK